VEGLSYDGIVAVPAEDEVLRRLDHRVRRLCRQQRKAAASGGDYSGAGPKERATAYAAPSTTFACFTQLRHHIH
jgi:hypothetical protein